MAMGNIITENVGVMEGKYIYGRKTITMFKLILLARPFTQFDRIWRS